MTKERPIIFNTQMVQAILNGRKTMTRRVCKRQPLSDEAYRKYNDGTFNICGPDFDSADIECPYGNVGDILWVREKIEYFDRGTDDNGYDGVLRYVADEHEIPWPSRYDSPKVVPSIHMPRTAARIILQITDIRVERLQDITRGDCMSEGCPFPNMADGPDPRLIWFADLWRSINGPDSWPSNPWVWVIAFKRIQP